MFLEPAWWFDSVLDFTDDLRRSPILWKISPGIWEAESISKLHGILLDWIFLARSFKCILEIFQSFKFFLRFWRL